MARWTVLVDGVETFAGYPEPDSVTLELVNEWVKATGTSIVWRLPGQTVEWDKNDPFTVALATAQYAQFKYGKSASIVLKTEGMKEPKAERRLAGDVY